MPCDSIKGLNTTTMSLEQKLDRVIELLEKQSKFFELIKPKRRARKTEPKISQKDLNKFLKQ